MGFKKFKEEFSAFISRGNVVDMAVGVIIGGAFTAIVNSLVNDILMPIVGICLGGSDFSNLMITIGEAEIKYGSFIQAVVNFLIVALVIFTIVKTINSLKKKEEPKKEEEKPAEDPADIKLLKEILEELKNK